jgi:hypothetical protein
MRVVRRNVPGSGEGEGVSGRSMIWEIKVREAVVCCRMIEHTLSAWVERG